VLHTTLTEGLVDEGLLREVLSRIQATRKDHQLAFTDRVRICIDGSERVLRVTRAGKDHIARECLGTSVQIGQRGPNAIEHDLGSETLALSVQKD
jgi:isoleucyl-tRNA synthetase